MNKMKYYYPFGEELERVVQQDRTPKNVFVTPTTRPSTWATTSKTASS